jgi:hypothetical protein
VQIYKLEARAISIEMLGRTAVDSIHAEKLDEVFDRLREDIEQHLARLKALLGLNKEEARS